MTTGQVKKTVMELGADICGIAPVSRFAAAPAGYHPRELLPGCRSVVVFGVRFPAGTLLAKTNSPYTLARNMLVLRLDSISMGVCARLESEGIPCIPVPSVEPYDDWDPVRRHGRGILSLKHAAEQAGLGRVGKNTLLIHEKYGNMVWLGAVLSSAELESDPVVGVKYCPEECRVCLDACPQKALDGVTIDQKACRERCFTHTEGGGLVLSCNLCRKVCPRRFGTALERTAKNRE
jgi:epoxyqueuosine reductase